MTLEEAEAAEVAATVAAEENPPEQTIISLSNDQLAAAFLNGILSHCATGDHAGCTGRDEREGVFYGCLCPCHVPQ